VDAPPSSARDALLWFAVLGAPAFWTVDELAALFWHSAWCGAATTRGEVPFSGEWGGLLLIGLVCMAGAVLAGLTGLRAVRVMGHDTGRDGTITDRRRFMGHAGMIISVLFTFGILLRLVAIFFVDYRICDRGS
jgi:hypothetical protein